MRLSADGNSLEILMGATLLTRPAFGVWCPDCALPSACEADAAIELEGAALSVVRVRACACGWRTVHT